MKDELGGKTITIFAGLRAKTYSQLIDEGREDKKKGTKKCDIKKILKFESYKNCLEALNLIIGSIIQRKTKLTYKSINKSILKTLQLFKTETKNNFTEKINKIALSSNDDKRIQSIDSIETYAYGANNDPVIEKDEIKCNNIIKRYKNDLL